MLTYRWFVSNAPRISEWSVTGSSIGGASTPLDRRMIESDSWFDVMSKAPLSLFEIQQCATHIAVPAHRNKQWQPLSRKSCMRGIQIRTQLLYVVRICVVHMFRVQCVCYRQHK